MSVSSPSRQAEGSERRVTSDYGRRKREMFSRAFSSSHFLRLTSLELAVRVTDAAHRRACFSLRQLR